MTEPGRDAVEELAEQFLARLRRGEHPPLSEYTDAHPELADRIRELFPAVLFAEQMEGARKPAAPPPETLGDYRLLREIGRGGMGVVYEAVQQPLGRRVALKVLSGGGATHAAAAGRFEREARAAARLHHTNIVPVFDVGEHNGTRYYAMQFIEGRGLDAVLHDVRRRRSTAPTEVPEAVTDPPTQLSGGSRADYFRTVARVGLQVAEALDYAHRHGVVHRDVKPSNLLLDRSGDVWVTDFGLAKAEGDADLTHTGDVVGTLRYMAPERFRGDSGPACDIYSLGVTLYEMVTLRPAFAESDRHRLLDQILRDEPPAPRGLDRRVPRDLETVVLKAMAKEPRDRYASAAHMAEDLRRFLADRPVQARRAPWSERAWRWCRRNPRLATLTGLVALLMAIILVGSPIVAARLYDQRQSALDELWSAHVERAKAQRLTNESGRRFLGLQSLDAAVRLGPSLRADPSRRQRLRDEFLACLTLADLGPSAPWLGYPPGSASACFDSKLERYARGDEAGAISIRRVDGDVEIGKLPAAGMGARALKFSPDGRYLAAGYHRRYQFNSEQFRLWDVATGKELLTLLSPTGCGEADFSPDSKRLAFGRDGNLLVVHDIGGDTRTFPVATLPTAIAFHPDGTRLAVALKRVVEIREVESGRVLATRNHDSDVWALAWRPGGAGFAAGNGTLITLWPDVGERPEAVLRGHEQTVYALAFNSTGELLASKANDATVRLWEPGTGRQLVRTPCVHTGCIPIHFGPGDRQLAFGSDGERLWLWDVDANAECRTLSMRRAGASWQPFAADFSPDGRWLAVGGVDGLRVWDCEAAAEVANGPALRCRGVVFSGDGAAVITAGENGLLRWPFTPDPPGLGPPETLGHFGSLWQLAASADRSTWLISGRDSPFTVLRADHLTEPAAQIPPSRKYALSPDGRLAVTGNLLASGVRVFDARTGSLVHDLPIDSSADVAFTPDGRLLVVSTDKDHRFYDAATWQPRLTLPKEPEIQPAGVSFTTDGRLMALRHAPTRLWLIDPATGAKLAELLSPDARMLVWHVLSPDGRWLAAAGAGSRLVLWDLALLRRGLAERGLEW